MTRGSGRGKSDGLIVSVMMKEEGQSVEVLRIEGFGNHPEGTNALVVICKEPFRLDSMAGTHRLRRVAER